MARGKKLELVTRCSNCYGDSPKAYKRELIHPMAKCTSEYQGAYPEWPCRPREPSFKPPEKNTLKKTREQMERKTTYGLDFLYHAPAKKVFPRTKKQKGADQTHEHTCMCQYVTDGGRPTTGIRYCPTPELRVDNAKVIHPNNGEPFGGDTIYEDSYPPYTASVMQTCRQPPIKAKDNIESSTNAANTAKNKSTAQDSYQSYTAAVMQSCRQSPMMAKGNIEKSTDAANTAKNKSTAQSDFVAYENVERPGLIIPLENTIRPTDPLQDRTEYRDFFTNQMKDPNMCKTTTGTRPDSKFNDISTVQADYTSPKGFERPKACYPPQSDHFSETTAKFDGATTFSSAYKKWPVNPYQLPIWAKKPTYKKPDGTMINKSLYMHDFRDPVVIGQQHPVKPQHNSQNIIIVNEADQLIRQSTYNQDFRVWQDVSPRESYRIIEVYQPPKEKMVCETNHRSHFTGHKASKMKPCRHTSEHRMLNQDQKMLFATTYADNFRDPRPKSTPSKTATNYPANLQRSKSAQPPAVPFMPENITFYSGGNIPTPDLNAMPQQTTNSSTSGSISGKAEINSTRKSTSSSREVNILKLDRDLVASEE